MNSKIRKLEENRPCSSPSPIILMGKHHSQEPHRPQELQAGPGSPGWKARAVALQSPLFSQ